jgi:hypothetical protein
VQVAADRPRSEFRSVDGNRYVQRSPQTRRQWELTIPYAAASANTVAVLRAAVESEDVWFASVDQLAGNMLPAGASAGATAPAIDCGGVPLLSITASKVISGRVRGGVSTWLSFWTDAGSGGSAAVSAVYPSGTRLVFPASAGFWSSPFTPASDGPVSITVAPGLPCRVAGLMVTEGPSAPTAFVHGEGSGMPCRVEVQDPDDTLTMRHDGHWRHDYSVTIREVG